MQINTSYAKNTFYSVSGFGLLMVSNIIFNSASGRLLGPEAFGAFTAFFYFLLGIAWPNASLQLSAAKYVIINKKEGAGASIRELSPDFWLTGLIFFCIVLALYPLLRFIYGIADPLEVLTGAVISALWLVTAGYRGIYQGRMDFLKLGLNTGMEGIVRAFAGIILILAGLGTGGALGASIIGSIAAIFLLVRTGEPVAAVKTKALINVKFIQTFLSAYLIWVPFGLINALDLTLVKFCIGDAESGYLSACALFGKNLITLSLFLSGVVYSYTLKSARGHFWTGIGLTALSFALPAAFTVFFGKELVFIILGSAYMKAVELLPYYITASMPVGIMLNIVNYSIAKNVRAAIPAIWILLALLVIIYYFAVKSLPLKIFLEFITGVLISADIILTVIVFIFRRDSGENALSGVKK